MNVIFHPEAIAEFDQSVAYYEDQQPGLGIEFAEEVAAAIQHISEYPNAWALLSRRTRRCLLNRFPFGVIYHVATDKIFVIAIAHLHRYPGYWKGRR